MLRILRAFAWMRWRIFVNSIEKTGARDALERFSVAIEHIAPIILALVMVPSALALAGLAGYAGYQLAAGAGGSIAVQIVRFVLLGATAVAIVAQVIVPAANRTNPVRFLLLPIPRRTLYVAQAAGTLADPWIMVLVPMVFAVPIGLAIGGGYVAALAALGAGILVLLAIMALAALTTTLIHLLLRDRRRGELVTLLFVLVLPLISIIPAALDSDDDGEAGQERAERPRKPPLPPWAMAAGASTLRVAPSELYTSTVTHAAAGRTARAAVPALALVASAAALHGIGLMLFARLLGSPASTGARRTASNVELWERVLPGLTPGASAVALAHVRLALRTPRGRTILFTPPVMLVFFGLLSLKTGDTSVLPFARMGGGLGLGAFASAIALLSVLPLALNQFAVDGAGLTRSLLSPLSTRQLLAGKAVGNGLIGVPAALLCVALAGAVFRGGSAPAWLNLVLSIVASYILVSPVAAVFSAILPRSVDMNSIGNASNAHGIAGLVGLAAFALAALPCIALVLIASRLLERPELGPVFLLGWCGVCFVAARLLMIPVERIFDRRRENLALLK